MAHRVPATLTRQRPFRPGRSIRSKPTPRATAAPGQQPVALARLPKRPYFHDGPIVDPWPLGPIARTASGPTQLVNLRRQPVSPHLTQAPVRQLSFSLLLMASTWGIHSVAPATAAACGRCHRPHLQQPSRRGLLIPAPASAISWASCGLVRKPTLSGTPASRRRSQSGPQLGQRTIPGPAGFSPWRGEARITRQSDSSRSDPPSRCTAATPLFPFLDRSISLTRTASAGPCAISEISASGSNQVPHHNIYPMRLHPVTLRRPPA